MTTRPLTDYSFVKDRLKKLKRIVVKVGTNILRGADEGLNHEVVESLARQIAGIRKRGIDVILVSSGAVGAGSFVMGLNKPPRETTKRQALAAIGQSHLMNHYETAFRRHGVNVAQVLLTRDSLDDRSRYLNVRNTFETLLGWKVLPIVNENDTVAVEELKFGDNDQLSALISGKIHAELLILLTDVGGLFDRPPGEEGAQLIRILRLDEMERVKIGAGGAASFGMGGMKSKLEAVRLATRSGILTFIGPGRVSDALYRVLEGEAMGTWCEPKEKRITARKRWLALGKRLGKGIIYIDGGAEEALRLSGKSLLPSGIADIEGTFSAGDLVSIRNTASNEVARGLCRYTSAELKSIKGMKTSEVERVLGPRPSYEVIHRDDLVVVGGGRDVEPA